MPTFRNQRMHGGLEMDAAFVEADLNEGFTLVHNAEGCLAEGRREDALQNLRQAANLLADGERRLFGITNDQVSRFRRELERLRTAINEVSHRMAISTRHRSLPLRSV